MTCQLLGWINLLLIRCEVTTSRLVRVNIYLTQKTTTLIENKLVYVLIVNLFDY